jgi:hypothetical protein
LASTRPLGHLVVVALALIAAGPAAADTLYVANNGSDAPKASPQGPIPCGAVKLPDGKAGHPCRSIRQAIANAAAGDRIVVGPGLYAPDLDGDGNPAGSGEENVGLPPPLPLPHACAMIRIEKPLTLESSAGALATVLDGMGLVGAIVGIDAPDVTIGGPDKGFLITGMGNPSNPSCMEAGVYGGAHVEGNIVIGGQYGVFGGTVVQGNVAIGAVLAGIHGTVLEDNHAILNGIGLLVSGGGEVKRSVVVANKRVGISAGPDAAISRSAVIGNREVGIDVFDGFNATIHDSNIYGNNDTPTFTGLVNCGLRHSGKVAAQENYWGRSTGPGPDPADEVCDGRAGITLVEPILKKPAARIP